jgi:prepilin-type N-terminal cleavage/methylation domain-containing protein
MLQKISKQKGFTIVELLIVIVVIGILAALVLNTFAGVQQRARDTERQTDITALATQLEVYYNDNGTYPAFSQIDTAAEAAAAFPGIDAGALEAPGQGFSLVAAEAANANQYGYQTTPTDCLGTSASPCTSFVLSYRKEGDNSLQTKSSLN